MTRALSLPSIYFLEHSFWEIHVRLLFFLLLLVLSNLESKMSRSHNKNPLQIFFKHENPHFVLFLLLALSSRSRHLPTQQEVLYLTPPDSSDSESQNENLLLKLYIFFILSFFFNNQSQFLLGNSEIFANISRFEIIKRFYFAS